MESNAQAKTGHNVILYAVRTERIDDKISEGGATLVGMKIRGEGKSHPSSAHKVTQTFEKQFSHQSYTIKRNHTNNLHILTITKSNFKNYSKTMNSLIFNIRTSLASGLKTLNKVTR